jgi:hypothetical protein
MDGVAVGEGDGVGVASWLKAFGAIMARATRQPRKFSFMPGNLAAQAQPSTRKMMKKQCQFRERKSRYFLRV